MNANRIKMFSNNIFRAQNVIGQREGFSECDLTKIYELYNCSNVANVTCARSDDPLMTTTGTVPLIAKSCSEKSGLVIVI